MMIEKSKYYGEQLGVESFSYLNGWLDCFKKWHGILLKSIHGECGASDLGDVAKDQEDLQ